MTIRRRALIAGTAALPFLRIPARAAGTPGHLTFGLSSYPPNFNPWVQAGTAAGTVTLQVHRGLMSYSPDGTLRGELAEKWTRDGDSGWVFTLRDATFHNGAKVTSADVKYSLEQVSAPKSTAYMRAQFQGVDRIETPDPRTVRIVMKQPTETLPLWLAAFEMPVVAAGSAETGKTPIGCGPFTITSQERGVSIDLAAYPGFYKPGLPKLKTLRFVVYADETARVAALQTGDVDLIEYVPWQSMAGIEADPKLRLQNTEGPFMYLTFNGATGPFKDPKVRLAVAHAVKRDEIVKSVFYGRGAALAGTPLVEASPFYDKSLADGWAYDPAKAKSLLAEAGLGGGFNCTLLATAQYSMHKDTAEIVQQNLAAIGIQVELALPDWATRVSLGNRGQYQFAVNGTTADSNDPDGLTALIDSTLGPAAARSFDFKDDTIAKTLAAGRAEFDPAKRGAIYTELQKLILSQTPIVSLAWRAQGYAMAANVKGFTNMPGALTFFSGTTLEETTLGA